MTCVCVCGEGAEVEKEVRTVVHLLARSEQNLRWRLVCGQSFCPIVLVQHVCNCGEQTPTQRRSSKKDNAFVRCLSITCVPTVCHALCPRREVSKPGPK